VPSENVTTPEPADRRTRKRGERRDHLLDLAADLVEQVGVEGVTMAALAEVADYAPASLYTYFPSRSALVAALQHRALVTLGAIAADHLRACDEGLAAIPADRAPTERVAALARLWSFADLFLAAPDHHPRDFRLQQQLLVTPGIEVAADAAAVLPAALGVLEVPRRLLAAAADVGALEPRSDAVDPIDQPVDGAFLRTIAWVVTLNGALLADGLTTGLPTTGASLGGEITSALLRGWGAQPDELAAARAVPTPVPAPRSSAAARSAR
jgi:AcrR family transcriptional regulator